MVEKYNNGTFKRTNLIAIPDYVLPMLLSRGMELDDITAAASNAGNGLNTTYNIHPFLQTCDQYLSNFDIKDIISSNYILYNNILGSNWATPALTLAAAKYNHTPEDTIALINALYNKGDSNLLLPEDTKVSNIDNNIELPFSIKFSEFGVFVILHSGFTNCITHNDMETKRFYTKVLVESIYNMYGEEVLTHSVVFSSYLGNLYSYLSTRLCVRR